MKLKPGDRFRTKSLAEGEIIYSEESGFYLVAWDSMIQPYWVPAHKIEEELGIQKKARRRKNENAKL